MTGRDDAAQNWALVNTPLGEVWSGRARYAAAMYFYERGDLSAEGLEAYRRCARLDGDDPLAILRELGLDIAWVQRFDPPHRR